MHSKDINETLGVIFRDKNTIEHSKGTVILNKKRS
jgi:hypothetical protein